MIRFFWANAINLYIISLIYITAADRVASGWLMGVCESRPMMTGWKSIIELEALSVIGVYFGVPTTLAHSKVIKHFMQI